jgi:preprotein translocase subunit SecG
LESYLNVAQILISLFIVIVILAQVKEGGGGLFGSAQSSGRTRRGLEKTLFQFTIILTAIFLVISIVSVRVT